MFQKILRKHKCNHDWYTLNKTVRQGYTVREKKCRICGKIKIFKQRG